jgi:polyisoprenoid-binding protein YceI
MKKVFLRAFAIVIFAAFAPAWAHATEWQIDPAHTAVTFSVRHMMISNVRGEFEKTSGTISANGTDPASVKIDATSLNTRVDKRDAHVKSPEFLDVDKYPTITFKSKKAEAAGPGKWTVTGDLTIHGVTKEVALDVAGPTPEVVDPFGNTRVGASATTTIKRSDFGLKWNKALEAGGVLVGDDIAIQIDVEAIKKNAPGARADLFGTRVQSE